MSDFDFGSSAFKPSSDRIVGERDERLKIGQRVLSFGVSFLDDCLGGIFPNDLILVGAKTGVGKTTLATIAAMTNARKGKTVHYFALEAEPNEIERRVKFDLMAELMRQRAEETRDFSDWDKVNYLDWYTGKIDSVTKRYEDMVEQVFIEKHKTLHTFYRTTDFFAEQFERMVLAIQDATDLIILDHLHYVDSDEANENRGYKQIVKKVRDTALSIGKPVMVVAHLRKSERKGAPIVPGIEDFHGTSDVPKMATKAVILAPDFESALSTRFVWSTYMNPAKCRPDGTRTRFVGRIAYDSRKNRYAEEYDCGRISTAGDKWELCDADKNPRWAR